MFQPNSGIDVLDALQVADMLPSKTIPEVGGKGHTRTLKAKTNSSTTTAPPTKKARACSVGVGVGEDEVEDEDSPRNVTTMNASFSSTSTFQISNTKVCSLLRHAQFYSNTRSEMQKCEKESNLFILRTCPKCVQWFSRRRWRRALPLFSRRSQGLYHQEINEK